MRKNEISSKLDSVFMLLTRLIASPFVLAIVVIFKVAWLIKFMTHYIAFGGETIVHDKEDKVMIYDIYQELKKQKNERT